jgi:hypothetical protein
MAQFSVKRLKRFQTGLVVVCVAGWMALLSLSSYYESRFFVYPRTPNPGTGMTTPYSVKGIVIFVPQTEARHAILMRHIAFGFWWTMVLVGFPLGACIKRKEDAIEALSEMKRSKETT